MLFTYFNKCEILCMPSLQVFVLASAEQTGHRHQYEAARPSIV